MTYRCALNRLLPPVRSLVTLLLCLVHISTSSASTRVWPDDQNWDAGDLSDVTVTAYGLELATAADWWNDDWKYRIPVVFENLTESTVERYELRLSIDTQTLISDGAMAADGDDIRFLSLENQTLPYYLQSEINSSQTIIWVQLPALQSNSIQQIYLYSGNFSSAIASQSNAVQTFTWLDDFSSNSMDNYEAVGLNGDEADDWTVDNGYAHHLGTSYSATALLIKDLYLQDSFYVETRAYTDDDDPLGVISNVDEEQDCYYCAQASAQNISRTGICRCNTDSQMAESAYRSIDEGSDHVYGLAVHDGLITMYLDGSALVDFDEESPLASGQLGIHSTNNDPVAYFDYLYVRRYVNPSPNITIGATERQGYRSSGAFTSPIVDSECQGTVWSSISWSGLVAETGSVQLEARVGDSAEIDDTWSSWYTLTGGASSYDLPFEDVQYAQIRLTLETSNTIESPLVDHASLAWYASQDLDQDGYLAQGCGGEDCNDQDGQIYPGAWEVNYDGIDQDCSGQDQNDLDLDGFPGGTNGSDCDDQNADIYPSQIEVCNGIDDNCDAIVDSDAIDGGIYAPDNDHDGYGSEADAVRTCTPPTGYLEDTTDCNDANSEINPAATELCNSIDDDCDDAVDEGLRATWYVDSDLDDYGDPDTAQFTCNAPESGVLNGSDCDDSDSAIYPGAQETCDDGIDQNCSGSDLSCSAIDDDSDGYPPTEGDCDDEDASVNPAAAEIPYDDIDQDCDGFDVTDLDSDGYDGGESGTDCNDLESTIHPGIADICDGIDNNCDSLVDNVDYDQDSYLSASCNGTDCDDGNAQIHPGASEIAGDGIDNNCNGGVDEPDIAPTSPPGTDLAEIPAIIRSDTATGCGLIPGSRPGGRPMRERWPRCPWLAVLVLVFIQRLRINLPQVQKNSV